MKSALENKLFSTKQTLNLRGRLVDLRTPKVMGVLNVTPDSFYDGGQYATHDAIVQQVEKMLADGATFIDIGAYSSRPGAADVPVAEEMRRALDAVKLVAARFPQALISIDTFRSTVAHAAVNEGACLVNDVSGGSLDEDMLETVARLQVPYVLMHMRGTPQTMTKETSYTSLLKDIVDYFHQRMHLLHQLGIKDVVVDPGFGFAKTPTQNFEILHHLEYFKILEAPLLVGLSRKSMIWKTLGVAPDDALNGTTALNTIALLKGASILRVHDVKEASQAITLVTKTTGTTNA